MSDAKELVGAFVNPDVSSGERIAYYHWLDAYIGTFAEKSIQWLACNPQCVSDYILIAHELSKNYDANTATQTEPLLRKHLISLANKVQDERVEGDQIIIQGIANVLFNVL
jgi:hypothetical protein